MFNFFCAVWKFNFGVSLLAHCVDQDHWRRQLLCILDRGNLLQVFLQSRPPRHIAGQKYERHNFSSLFVGDLQNNTESRSPNAHHCITFKRECTQSENKDVNILFTSTKWVRLLFTWEVESMCYLLSAKIPLSLCSHAFILWRMTKARQYF